MKYRWAEGFHAPKGISAEQVAIDCESRNDWSPEGLLEATKRKKHVLHETVWTEGDQVWAQRARLDYCRRTIGGVHIELVHGGKIFETRAAEFVRVNGDGRWASMDQIRSDSELLKAYAAEVGRFLAMATAKQAKLQQLLEDE